MNDNDIINALVKCSHLSNGCSGCPLFSSAWDEYGKSIAKCEGELICYALDLINHQKAEIESLEWERDSALKLLEVKREEEQRVHNSTIKELKTINSMIPATLSRVKAEAIKEFAEKLKAGINEDIKSGWDCADYLTNDLPDIIDNLVNEMTEEQ